MKTLEIIDELNNRADSDELSKLAAGRLANYVKTVEALTMTVDTLGKIIETFGPHDAPVRMQ